MTRARRKLRTPLAAHGEPMLWLTGGSLIICVVMVVGLLAFVLAMGLGTFWPAPVERVRLHDGEVVMGEITRTQWHEPDVTMIERRDGEVEARLRAQMEQHDGHARRRLMRTGNFELTNRHFLWIDDAEYAPQDRDLPDWAVVLERVEWQRFYGFPDRFLIEDEVVAEGPEAVWQVFREHHGPVRGRWERRKSLEEHDLGRTFRQREQARLAAREVEIEHDLSPLWAKVFREVVTAGGERLEVARARLERLERNIGTPPEDAVVEYRRALNRYQTIVANTERENRQILERIDTLKRENDRFRMAMVTADGGEKIIPLDQIVRAYPANRLNLLGKLRVYLSRWWEFLTDEPREANVEGGVFPAIVGTVLMTLIMAVLVVPFGVLAALYLREYARSGPVVSAVRIAINNLAGVPSIVFGVFGLGFFCYGVGGFIDTGPGWVMPRPVWFALLSTLAVLAAAAFGSMVAGYTRPGRPVTRLKRMLRVASGTLWLTATLGALVLVATTPFFDGFFQANAPNPTFGKGALIWASFTLALLTLPVVIVATEEALAAVPNSMREGSYACGASKWQTIKRIILPRAMPGIMTGTILAMARGAGEVAPLMLVGAVKLAPELPVSWRPGEHFGVDRSFMHLGFHIYDLGFQSQNSEAAKPLVFTTTLLLITLVASMNLVAVYLRSRLRRKFVGAQF